MNDEDNSQTKELMKFWDNFQVAYTTYADCYSFPIFAGLCSLAKISKFKNILELSCGGGGGSVYLTNICKQPGTFICSGDISQNMVACTNKRLGEEKSQYYTLCPLSETIEQIRKTKFSIEDLRKDESNEKSVIKTLQCDNENICFQDSSFEVVISNFSLHLVHSAKKMVQESARVLAPGGVAVFSIWGRPENTPLFTLLPNILKKNNIAMPDTRSSFYLNEPSTFIPLIKENGFKTVNYTYSSTCFPYTDFESYYVVFLKDNGILKSLEESLREKLIEEAKVEFNKVVHEDNGFLQFESVQLLCTK